MASTGRNTTFILLIILSIVVFLCFSVGMDLAHALLPSLRAWQPDCTINGYANADNIDSSMKEKINGITGFW